MELLRDTVPGIARVAVLTSSLRPEHVEYVKTMEAGRPHDLQLQPVAVGGPDQYQSAFAAMTKAHADAVIILGDVMFTRDSGRLAELAVAHRLPSIYLFKAFVLAGGLLAYGPDEQQLLDLATQYIEKILKGANPAELPVAQPTKFHLAINQRLPRRSGSPSPQRCCCAPTR